MIAFAKRGIGATKRCEQIRAVRSLSQLLLKQRNRFFMTAFAGEHGRTLLSSGRQYNRSDKN
jgi:hypothetical protein